jgi:hypothetical protein
LTGLRLQRYTFGWVGTFTKVVLGLLIIVAVTTILVTPDPSDDVMVILHQQHVLTAQPVLLSVIQVSLSTLRLSQSEDVSDVALSADLLDLVCSRLC